MAKLEPECFEAAAVTLPLEQIRLAFLLTSVHAYLDVFLLGFQRVFLRQRLV